MKRCGSWARQASYARLLGLSGGLGLESFGCRRYEGD